MACAYCGTTFMPPLIGLVTSRISMALYPFALLFFLILMLVMCEWLFKVKNRKRPRCGNKRKRAFRRGGRRCPHLSGKFFYLSYFFQEEGCTKV